MKNIIKRLLGKKSKVDLDGDGKIESYREEIQGVFSQFRTMRNKLYEVNEKLEKVVEEETFVKECEADNLERIILQSTAKLEASDKVIEKAKEEMVANNKLREKVEDFIL